MLLKDDYDADCFSPPISATTLRDAAISITYLIRRHFERLRRMQPSRHITPAAISCRHC